MSIQANRPECIDCPNAHEPVCCHVAINDYDERANDDADPHARLMQRFNRKSSALYGVLVANPWEQE